MAAADRKNARPIPTTLCDDEADSIHYKGCCFVPGPDYKWAIFGWIYLLFWLPFQFILKILLHWNFTWVHCEKKIQGKNDFTVNLASLFVKSRIENWPWASTSRLSCLDKKCVKSSNTKYGIFFNISVIWRQMWWPILYFAWSYLSDSG